MVVCLANGDDLHKATLERSRSFGRVSKVGARGEERVSVLLQ